MDLSLANRAGRGRVRVDRGTVRTDNGELLRGGAVWIHKTGQQDGSQLYAADPAYYARLKAAHVNAVRLVWFDPWQRSRGYPHYDVCQAGDLALLLESFDRVVALAGQAGLYVMINYHDVGRYEAGFAEAFWRAVAPRYAHETHVFYELLNEPVEWFPEHYTPEVLRDQDHLYTLVRGLAPDTHLVLLTFANPVGFVEGCTTVSVAEQLQCPDWQNASIGLHLYYTGGTSEPIRALRERFPVLNTETMPPPSHGGDETVRPMDGDDWGAQTMERLEVSWFLWLADGPERFAAHFEIGVLADARAKGYEWQVTFPPPASYFARWRAALAQLPLRDCCRVMGLRWRHFALLLFLSLALATFDALMLAFLVPLVQGISGGGFASFLQLPSSWLAGAGSPFLRLGLLVFLIGLLRNAAHLSVDLTQGWLYGRSSEALSEFAYARYLTFGKAYFDRSSTGRLNALVDYHHDVLNVLLSLYRVVSTALLVSAYFALMFVISWPLTLIGLVLFPVLHVLSSWWLSRNSEAAAAISRTDLDAGHLKWQLMSALPLFRTFANEASALAGYRKSAAQFRDTSFRLWRLRSLSSRLLDIGTLFALLIMLGVATLLRGDGLNQMGALLVFFFVVRLAMPELARFQTLEAEIRERMPRVREFLALFDDRHKFIVPSGTRTFGELAEAIELRGLTFRYPDGPVALSDVHLRIAKGQTVALVGPSGGGKSTLTQLLMRFYDVSPGTVFLDGHDLRDFSIPSLRQRFALVSQEVQLLSDSLRANLVFGLSRTVTDAELLHALDAAQLTELLTSLPEGLASHLGDNGTRLSGGQRQRVAIARAMLKQASLLILDEATSALDALTEAQVQQAIDRALAGTTSLVIAHRLATIRNAHRIAVLDGGRIVESGTLDELLALRGLFHRMWEQQSFS